MTEKPMFQMSADSKVIRSVFEVAEIGEVVTYESLDRAIGRDVREFAANSIYTVRNALLREKQMVFECIPKVGYKRLGNSGIVSSMERDRLTIARHSSRSIRKLGCVEYAKLTNEEKRSHTVAAAQFGVLQMMSKASTSKRIESNVNDRSELAIGETLKLFMSNQ